MGTYEGPENWRVAGKNGFHQNSDREKWGGGGGVNQLLHGLVTWPRNNTIELVRNVPQSSCSQPSESWKFYKHACFDQQACFNQNISKLK